MNVRWVRTSISEGKVILYGFYGEIWRNVRALEQPGTTQITFGSRTNQSSANGIFGQQNNTTASKNSVSDIKRMLARDSRSTQTQAANSLGQESIVTSTLSYSEALRNQRQQTKNTTLALKN